ncbi:MAG: hypothetical protein IPJ76_01900 [Flavobacteriales bacterium]|nr:MAG: hypothetical protein IPJ76_01900 [Flavobacteriales bacterium]
MSNLLVIVNLIGLFFIDLFMQSGINITHDLPSTMQPGSQVKVTMNVEKGALGGFAKLQIDLPEGMTATLVDGKGASFTFDDQKAKFIWMSLPMAASFRVSFTLTASATVSGKMPISGRFSYIEDNERKTQELPPTVVDLGGGSAVAQEALPPVAAPATEVVEPVEETASAEPVDTTPIDAPAITITDAPMIPASQGAGNVSATRTITMVSETELLVEVLVNKGSIRGFGKLQESLPAGFTAMEKNNAEAIFTAQDRIVKFVWLNLPASNEVKVTYKLRSNATVPGDHQVNGEFGYLLNDETQKATLGSTRFAIGADAWAAHQAQLKAKELEALVINANSQDASDTEMDRTAQESASQPGEPNNSAAATRMEDPVAQRPARQNIPAPETGITYKVQITAAHREVGSAYFAGRHRYNGDFGIERHEGWIKYTTGRHAEYRQARDQRQAFVSAGHNFPGPFVTAYNNGERITVQEALMITRQNWVQ